MEENRDDSKTNDISTSTTKHENWNLAKDGKSNGNVSTNYDNWDLSNYKTDSFSNASNNEDVTIANDYSNDESTKPGINELSQSTTNMESSEQSQTENAESINDSWGNKISSNDYHNNGDNFNSPVNDCKNSEINVWNSIRKNSFGNNQTNSRSYNFPRGRGRIARNFASRTSNGYNQNNVNRNSEPAKHAIPKSTYVPPEFEDDDDLTIEKGSNFDKYDKIEVTVSGIEVPKSISSFQESGLRNIFIDNLIKCHYTTPTPIQKYALPIIMGGRDMIATAQTGSGKTAAFLLPIMNSLLSNPSELIVDENHCEPHALIVAPTRELAIQICELACRLTKGTQLQSELLYGGTATFHQKQKILRGVHLIVATPGRLLDFVERGFITFSSIKFFVLDEADRMLDMGFQNDIEIVLTHVTMVSPAKRSTVMFSATLPESVQQIAMSYLKSDYLSVAVGMVGGACKDVTQIFQLVTKFEKKNELLKLLEADDDCQGTIVFIEQKRNADFVAAYLSELDIPTTSIHGDREQSQREEALRDFKTKRMKVLVATTVASRGLDITGVTKVVNFDLPKTIEEYVHRIGRTGRLGNSGKAISFFDPDTDAAIAPLLVSTLKNADQEVPVFLTKYSEGCIDNFDQFNDIRTDVTVTSELLNGACSDEEVW